MAAGMDEDINDKYSHAQRSPTSIGIIVRSALISIRHERQTNRALQRSWHVCKGVLHERRLGVC